ncbi:MAG: YraN family protein [Defluviitaleaceae bacterium]|nr:YraN family protein [Defluviitaleaceae bacterium]
MINKVQAGRYGQDAAVKFLQSKGLTLVEENYRLRSGEIDLIMRDGAYMVFIEVKYRRGLAHGLPREAIGYHKQQKIIKTAMHYIARYRLDNQDFRFDAVELLETADGLAINHIENAFWG